MSCPRGVAGLEVPAAVGVVLRLVARDPGLQPPLSWTLAAETPTMRGSPFASDRMCILEPGLLRSTRLGPVFCPPFLP
jgi:hypothetical protein